MIGRLFVALLAAPIRVYRYVISPMLVPRCRFFPSCSEYALQALQRHGPMAGSWLAVARLCRCHPLNDGGLDLVPDDPPRLWAGGGRWPVALRSASLGSVAVSRGVPATTSGATFAVVSPSTPVLASPAASACAAPSARND